MATPCLKSDIQEKENERQCFLSTHAQAETFRWSKISCCPLYLTNPEDLTPILDFMQEVLLLDIIQARCSHSITAQYTEIGMLVST